MMSSQPLIVVQIPASDLTSSLYVWADELWVGSGWRSEPIWVSCTAQWCMVICNEDRIVLTSDIGQVQENSSEACFEHIQQQNAPEQTLRLYFLHSSMPAWSAGKLAWD